MERRVALATAAAAAATLGLGTVAFASLGGGGLLGLAGSDAAEQIVPGSQVQEINNVVVVVSGSSTTVVGAPVDTSGQLNAPAAEPEATTPPIVPVWTGAPGPTSGTPTTGSASQPTVKATTTSAASGTTTKTTVTVTATSEKPVTTTTAAPVTTNAPTTQAPSTTAKPVTSTTAKPVTSTTVRPRGVPADWPANKPIPPMPPNCKQPQLELNGVWNCDN